MGLLYGVVVFFLGLVVGSFLNVIILRLNTEEKILNSRSRCFACGKKLSWYELIPILSFIIQRGKCRNCVSSISWQYPIVELATGTVFTLVWWRTGLLLSTFYFLFSFSFLIAISVYDFRHKVIPDKLVYPLIAISFFSPVFNPPVGGSDFTSGIIVATAYFAFFGSLWLVSKGTWMGFGDAKLSVSIAFMFAWPLSMWALIFSFWIGGLVGIIGLIFKKFSLRTQVPFGPFMALGSFFAFMLF